MLAIRLPTGLEKRLTKLAKATGRTKTFYAREAITEHLEDLEDMYLSEKVLMDVESGRESVFTNDELIREYRVK